MEPCVILLAAGTGPTSSKIGPEISAEQALDFNEARGMILAAARRDLDRAHQRRESAGLRPVEARGNTVKKAGAVGIAAAGGIHHFGCLDARNLDPLAVGVDDRTLRTAGKHECPQFFRHFLELAAGTLLEHPAFVIVDG